MNRIEIKIRIFWIIFLLASCSLSHGQSGSNLTATFKLLNPFDKNVPSPEASSLVNNLENPVGLYTGSINYTLPLYEINVHDFLLSLALNYSNNGIKVNELSSNVGLGWSLKTGGVITRIVKGMRDEINYNGYTSSSGSYSYNYLIDGMINNDDEFNYLLNLAEGIMDGEPDLFYYNFASYSGMFIFDKNQNIHFIPEQNFEIVVVRVGNSTTGQSNHINSFKIITEEGIEFSFGLEATHRDKVNYEVLGLYYDKESEYNSTHNADAKKYLAHNTLPTFNQEHYTAWHLSKIVFPNYPDVITFNYDTDNTYTYIGTVEHYSAGEGTKPPNNFFDVNNPFVVKRTNMHRESMNSRISSITWSKGRVDFIPNNTPRQDVNELNNKKGFSISMIKVYNKDNTLIREIELTQSYFNNTGVGSEYTNYTSYFKRLRLDAVRINDQVFHFQYIYNDTNPELRFPSRNTIEMDFWGYYKKLPLTVLGGPNQPSQPVGNRVSKPKLYVYPNDFNNPLYKSIYSIWPRTDYQGTEIMVDGNDRTPELQYTQIGMLEKIVLPTGGSIEYEYELNDFFFDGKNRFGGGVRVKQVKFSDYNGSENRRIISYEYTETEGNSSGRITNVPDFAMQNLHAKFDEVNWYNNPAFSGNPSLKQAVGTIRFNDSKTGLGGTHGGYVGYSTVREIENDGSFIEYVFDIPVTAETKEYFPLDNNTFLYKTTNRLREIKDDIHNYYSQLGFSYFGYSQPLWIDNAPFLTNPVIDWCRGNILEEKYFDTKGMPIRRIEYSYELIPLEISIYYCQASIYNLVRAIHTVYMVLGGNLLPVFGPNEMYAWDIAWGINKYNTGRKQLITKTVEEFTDNGILTTQTDYLYNEIGLIKETIVVNSNNNIKSTNIYYPLDYTNLYCDAIAMMKNLNMLNYPIETITSIDGKVTEATFNKYDFFGNIIQPSEIYKIEVNEPTGNFTPSNQLSNGQIDHRYKKQAELKHSPDFGNLLEIKPVANHDVAYIWGYNHTLLIAKIENAAYNQVAYSSFEDKITAGGTNSQVLGNLKLISGPRWYRTTTSIVGDFALGTHSGVSPIETTQAFPPGTYVITFYSKGSSILIPQALPENIQITYDGTWFKFNAKIILNAPSKIEVKISNTIIDDLRLYPINAQMTSYTYKPLVGVTTITDPSGRTTYYQYDALGRLQYIKNHEGHYLKQYDYHYR